ncbi:NarL family transcriptional regulator [bacterium]|mgnify:CR=1 FL=1|nr:NarL family transcriptional regulator [bacterium]|tara:strand:+ start:10077 stop:11276 length:1200 start_codon:yes stop_codon:yes gene_type:complete
MRVPYAQSSHDEEEIEAVVSVLKNNTALGPKTNEFERAIAEIFGKKYGIMVNSGSSANLLAFEIMNLQRGDEVITPLLTFGTVVAPIIQKGLVPVFVDVEQDTYIVNIDSVKAAITPKTRVLMIPSLLGNVPNLKALREIADEHNLWLVEDSCDTLGATYDGQPTGVYSDISTTSFYGSHIINGAGGGGMILVNDPTLAERLVILRGWGRKSSLYGETASSELLENRFTVELEGVPYDNKFVFSEIGYNFLPLEISSAFALVQLDRFPKFAEARKNNFARLQKFLTQYEDFFVLPRQTTNTKTNWLAFPVTIKDSAPFTRRDLATFLEEQDIQTRPIFTGNILKQPAFKEIDHRLAEAEYPNTEMIMRGGLVFGCHQGLTSEQLTFLETKIAEFISKYL